MVHLLDLDAYGSEESDRSDQEIFSGKSQKLHLESGDRIEILFGSE